MLEVDQQRTFDLQPPTDPFPAHCLSPIDQAVVDASEQDEDFASMRHHQIDREIQQ